MALSTEQHQTLGHLSRTASELIKLKIELRVRPPLPSRGGGDDIEDQIDAELDAINAQRKELQRQFGGGERD